MISVTRMNGQSVTINAILIETIEAIPDTLITLTTGKKLIVLEEVDSVVSLVQKYMNGVGSIQVAVKSQDVEGS
jgi:flagellar protein FlbD